MIFQLTIVQLKKEKEDILDFHQYLLVKIA